MSAGGVVSGLRKAAQAVIDGYEAQGLVHDVSCEDLTEKIYALAAALSAPEPEPILDIARLEYALDVLYPLMDFQGSFDAANGARAVATEYNRLARMALPETR